MRDLRETHTLLLNLDRDVHELEGFLRGIALDGHIRQEEVESLRTWCRKRRDVHHVGPFAELIPLIEGAIADGVVDEEERADILWFCEQIRTPSIYYSVVTSDLQRLHGMLAGIAADGVVEAKELLALREWMDGAEKLRGTWPYDEIEGVIREVLADGKIDEHEHAFLAEFTREFLESRTKLVLEKRFDEELVRNGVCAADPEIEFAGKRFCFTGRSRVATREDMEAVVRRLGGTTLDHVTRELDTLVVAENRGRSWAVSCYGRKIEIAIALRKRGQSLAIVSEADFWEAAAERGVRPTPRAD
jgi:hypothetical protein